MGWKNVVTVVLLLSSLLCVILPTLGAAAWVGNQPALWLLIAGVVWSNVFFFSDVIRRNRKP